MEGIGKGMDANENNGNDALCWKAAGNAAFKRREYPAALESYRKALSAIEKGDAETKYAVLGNICLAQYQLKDYQGALQSINEAIDCFPTRFKGYERKLRVLIAQGDREAARATCSIAERNVPAAKAELMKLRAKMGGKMRVKGFLNKYPSLYAENPAGSRCEAERMSTAGKRLLEKIKDLLGNGGSTDKDTALMNGLFHSLLTPEKFRRIVYKSNDIPEKSDMPRSFQDLLNNRLYAEGLEKLFPKIKAKADTVLENVKKKGAKVGDVMDEATEAKLKPQVLNEAFAYEVVSLINNVARLHGAAIARAHNLIAPTDDERADYDQLGERCIDGLVDNELGYGIQDNFLGDAEGEFLEELRKDVLRMQRKGLFTPEEDVSTTRNDHKGDTNMAWITLPTAEKTYPAIHFLMEQLHALPYELNKKFERKGKQLDLIGIPTNAKILLTQSTEDPGKDEERATLDGTTGKDDNGIKISCVYHFTPWEDACEGRLCLKPIASDFTKIEPIADRLVVYRSRQLINRIEPLSASSPQRMTLAMYFNGAERDGW